MTKYVCNALSGKMLTQLSQFKLDGIEITEDFFRRMTKDAVSFMGHHDISEQFGLEYHRENLYLQDGDVLYIAQYDEDGRKKKEEQQVPNNEKALIYFQIYVEGKNNGKKN